jgi:phenylpropionate dioxygenase-like ring-hydroxylating dioxygenase large terminal subunit
MQALNDLASVAFPKSWYYACPLNGIDRRPAAVSLGRRELVAFRTAAGDAAVLDGRCVHLGAKLAAGCVVGNSLQCPMHEWKFDVHGKCVRIPASETIPEFARQGRYTSGVLGGHLFFSNSSEPAFDLPFFAGVGPDQLHPSRPFAFDVDVPWYMVGANGFDLQHFRAAHDRTLLEEPFIDQPSPFARRIRATFSVAGNGIRDRLTRWVSGPKVTMTVTSWCGTAILVSAEFRRTTSYGMVWVTPLSPVRSRLRTIVWVPRARTAAGRMLFDPADAAVRRSFIRTFMLDDRNRSAGIRYSPGTLIGADAVLAGYLQWLQSVAVGETWASHTGT